jgi:membrane protein
MTRGSERPANLIQFLETAYERANDASGGRLQVLRRAIERFGKARAAQAAAAMAYYVVFSLFPLLLVLVAALGFFVADAQARQEVISFVGAAIPVSQGLISRNVQKVLEQRGAVGIVGLIGLLWSASGMFTVLAHNVNRAWSRAEPRSFLKSRLVGLAMVGTLVLLLGLSLISSAVLSLLPRLRVPLWGGITIYETVLWEILSRLIPWLFTFLLFFGMYRWLPNVKVERRAAFWGALATAIAWEVVKNGFVLYLGSGLVQYELVYGSLGTVVALMLWIYLGGWITLFGAHLSAAIAKERLGDRGGD